MNKLRSILLIDDDEVTNFINTELLSELNVSEHLQVCENGQEGIEYLTRAHDAQAEGDGIVPDLIFLDMNMPIMNGAQFLIEYNKIFESSNTVIVVLSTAHVQEEIYEALKESNLVVSFLEKPLDKKKVLEVVDQVNRIYIHNCPPENGNGN